ncbi:MAG: hypothetical protein IKH44_14845 [Bacteroidales bacterium]|nr:hypothetical protein [Bacteroidales bacterium]
MPTELSFKELPFAPVEGQVIYVEQSYHKKLNKFIKNNYNWLRITFRNQGLDFCYLPLLAEETIGYNAPYLNEKERIRKAEQIPSLANYLAGESLNTPVLVFGLDIPVKNKEGQLMLQAVTIETKWYISTKSTFSHLAKEIKALSESQSRKYHEKAYKPTPNVRFSLNEGSGANVRFSLPEEPVLPKRDEVMFSLRREDKNESSIDCHDSEKRNCPTRNTEEADSNFDIQSQMLLNDFRQIVRALRNIGVNTMILRDVIDEEEHLSRLLITKDYHIFLIDYENLEIKMPVLPKSVFFLFLRHPEGIRFKELSDYYSELLQIYQEMNPIGGGIKQEQSIRDITDPCSNSINEKCARIREAFVANFDDRLAKNYYVTGKRGEAKRILLDESMIIWEK